jgi:hypothetical protein
MSSTKLISPLLHTVHDKFAMVDVGFFPRGSCQKLVLKLYDAKEI